MSLSIDALVQSGLEVASSLLLELTYLGLGLGYLPGLRMRATIALVGLAVQIGLLWLLYPEGRSLQPGSERVELRDRLGI